MKTDNMTPEMRRMVSSLGGKARAKKLPPEVRSAIAQQGGLAKANGHKKNGKVS